MDWYFLFFHMNHMGSWNIPNKLENAPNGSGLNFKSSEIFHAPHPPHVDHMKNSSFVRPNFHPLSSYFGTLTPLFYKVRKVGPLLSSNDRNVGPLLSSNSRKVDPVLSSNSRRVDPLLSSNSRKVDPSLVNQLYLLCWCLSVSVNRLYRFF